MIERTTKIVDGKTVEVENHLDYYCVGEKKQRKDGTTYHVNPHWTDRRFFLAKFRDGVSMLICPLKHPVRPVLRVRESYEIYPLQIQS